MEVEVTEVRKGSSWDSLTRAAPAHITALV